MSTLFQILCLFLVIKTIYPTLDTFFPQGFVLQAMLNPHLTPYKLKGVVQRGTGKY